MHDECRVLEHVVYVVGCALLETLACHQLGQHRGQHVHRAHEGVVHVRAQEQAFQLVRHPLGRYAQKLALVRHHAGVGGRLDGEPQLRGEPACPQDAQRVLGEAAGGVAHGAYRARLQVRHAAVRIEDAAFWMVGQRIHGEVAAGQVLLDGADEGDGLGVARVRVGAIVPVGRDLQRLLIHYHGERAVRRARLVRAAAGRLEHALHLLPGCVGGHVDIGARPPEQRIAHETAHAPCLEAGFLESGEGEGGLRGQGDRDGARASGGSAASLPPLCQLVANLSGCLHVVSYPACASCGSALARPAFPCQRSLLPLLV